VKSWWSAVCRWAWSSATRSSTRPPSSASISAICASSAARFSRAAPSFFSSFARWRSSPLLLLDPGHAVGAALDLPKGVGQIGVVRHRERALELGLLALELRELLLDALSLLLGLGRLIDGRARRGALVAARDGLGGGLYGEGFFLLHRHGRTGVRGPRSTVKRSRVIP